jgi:phosphomevalonate kinase
MMGDVSSGSSTVSMVRQVLKWQKEHPEHAKKVTDELHRHNMEVERGFTEICELEDRVAVDWETMATQDREQVRHLPSLLRSRTHSSIHSVCPRSGALRMPRSGRCYCESTRRSLVSES